MKYTFNHEEFILNEIPHGVLFVEIKSTQGYFIEKEVFDFLKILIQKEVTFDELIFNGYSQEEKKEFLDSLINLGIIKITKEE